MKQEIEKILETAIKEFESIKDSRALEELRTKYLGKKGIVKEFLNKIGDMPVEMKKEAGKLINDLKDRITDLIEKTEIMLQEMEKNSKLAIGVDDISAQRKQSFVGYRHPVSYVIKKMTGIFKKMGYAVMEGPELEEEFYNFDALNIPSHHPARDDHDSFYITKGKLMRTHTSPVQIRVMKEQKPPIAIVVPGRCYRRDAVDATHLHTFHQMEGLVVDKNISFADLKGTLLLFARMMFGEKTNIRLRPDYFPFTEPSAELAVSCPICGSKGCNVCKFTGWIEIGGCGLVDPEVFKNVGYDPEEYSGFAFGVGVERIAMKFFGINDIRDFYENDMRLLEQFVKF